MELGRSIVNSSTCSSFEELVRQLGTILEVQGLPGPDRPTPLHPCGKLVGPAYIKEDGGGVPSIVYAKADGTCPVVAVGGGGGGGQTLAYGTADAYIGDGGTGTINGGVPVYINKTGRAIWKGSQVVVNSTALTIIASDAASVIGGVANQDAPTAYAHFGTLVNHSDGHFDATGIGTPTILDPYGVLPLVRNTDTAAFAVSFPSGTTTLTFTVLQDGLASRNYEKLQWVVALDDEDIANPDRVLGKDGSGNPKWFSNFTGGSVATGNKFFHGVAVLDVVNLAQSEVSGVLVRLYYFDQLMFPGLEYGDLVLVYNATSRDVAPGAHVIGELVCDWVAADDAVYGYAFTSTSPTLLELTATVTSPTASTDFNLEAVRGLTHAGGALDLVFGPQGVWDMTLRLSGISILDDTGILPAVRVGDKVVMALHSTLDGMQAYLATVQVGRGPRDREKDAWLLAKQAASAPPETGSPTYFLGSQSAGQTNEFNQGNDLKWYSYIPPGGGGGSGSLIIQFQLTADKVIGSTTAQAYDLSTGGQLTVLDLDNNFAGKVGAHGFALQYTTNYAGTGAPGAHIITMETPLRFIAVTLYQAYSMAGTECTPISTDQYGHPFEGFAPTDDPLVVQDPYNLAMKAKVGDKWLVVYSESLDQYDFVLELCPLPSVPLRVRGTPSGQVQRGTPSFPLSGLVLISGTLPCGVTLPSQITVTVPSDAKMDVKSGRTVVAVQDITVGTDINNQWSSADAENWHWIARGKEGWDATKKMVLYSNGTEEPELKWKEVTSQNVITSIDELEFTYPTSTSIRLKLKYKERTILVLVDDSDPNSVEDEEEKQEDLLGTACTT